MFRLVAGVCLIVGIVSCSVVRHLPEGSYLLKRNILETDKEAPRQERISAGELERRLRQRTNRHFLGTNLYTWLYAQANPDKTNGWHNFLRRAGEEPVVWSPERSESSAENLENYIASRGFFDGQANWQVDTVRGRKVKIRYGVKQGAPSYFGDVTYTFRDSLLRGPVLADSAATLIHTGNIFDVQVLDAERARITENLRNEGYYDFNVGHIYYSVSDAGEVDGVRTLDVEMVVRRKLETYAEDGTPVYDNHRVYTLGDIAVYPDYDPLNNNILNADTLRSGGLDIIYDGRIRVWPRLLRRAIKLRSGELYSATNVEATSTELMRLGAFRSASVLFEPENDLLNCDIRLVPGLRQSFGLDLEGSTTSSFYGLRTTLRYQNRNAFRGAELFDASLTGGFEFLKASSRKLSYELGASVSLSFPRFVFWSVERNNKVLRPMSTMTLSANWQDRVYYSRTLFGLSWEYGWAIRRFEKFTLRPADINLVRMGHLDDVFRQQLNNPYLEASYADQLIAGISASWVYNDQPRDLGAGAMVARLNLETTGNLFSGLVRMFGAKKIYPEADSGDAGDGVGSLSEFSEYSSSAAGRGHYNIFGIQFSQYVRGEGSFSHKIVLGDKTSLAYRFQAGAIYAYGNSSSLPFDKLFFAGGVNSMRGWAVRTLGPGTVPYERQDYPAQMGDVKLEANVEFRFPVWEAVNGALFADVGNVWFMRSKPAEYPESAVFRLRSFSRQLAFDIGVGARVDLRFVVLRLDWGIQLHSPNRPSGERWIRDFKWRNTALSFGVGYPF